MKTTSTHILRRALFPILLLACVAPAAAQSVVTGTVLDATERSPLPGATVVATHVAPDSTQTGTITDAEGAFRLNLPAGTHRLQVSYIGYVTAEQTISAEDKPIALDAVMLGLDTVSLNEAVVEALQERVTLRGDTAVYNADAFKVNPDASAEDLVSKMPGIVIQNGTVQAQGEDVRRVLVDGEEFFGDDATAALRNLPAEVVKEVEVFDRQSEQARFTGFDDGNEEKTINIVTRAGMQNGQFGRLYGGYGTETRYLAGGQMNMFDGARRISIIGMSNNVNQQNFSSEDLLGVMSSGGGGRGGPRGGGRRGGGQRGGGGGRGSDAGNYMIGEQGGINTTNSLGLNYTDRWGERVRINGSYFFNGSGNSTDALLEREYFLTDGVNQFYSETNVAESDNANHRLNFRLEAELSDATELTISPRLSMQRNASESVLTGLSAFPDGTLLSQTRSAYASDNLGYNTNTNISLRHRFPTRGRTISASAGLGLNGRNGDSDQNSENLFYDASGNDAVEEDSYLRDIDNAAGDRSYSANIAYTEPVGERGQIQLSYRPSFSGGDTDQEAFRFDPITGTYSILDSSYTSLSDRRVFTQRGGVSYRLRGERFNVSAGLDLQNERLAYEQAGPRAFEVDRSFLSLLPSANARIELTEAANLNISYRPSTDIPGVNQLRNVIDDTNPILITSGNPDLSTSTSHRFDVRLRTTQPTSGKVFMAFANLTTTRDYIGTAAVLAETDTVLTQGITLARGAQFSYPVNLDGYWSARSFVTYGRPIGFLKSNTNVSAGLSYSSIPSLINGTTNRSDALQFDGRFFLGSNISERLDFSLSYGLSYTTVAQSSASAQDGNYIRHRGGAQLTWLPWKGLVLTSDVNLSSYSGLSDTVDPTVALWNVGVGYKFLQNDVAEVRLTVTDLLNQNASVGRSVTGLYIEDNQTEALGRYVMLNLIYKLRHFGL